MMNFTTDTLTSYFYYLLFRTAHLIYGLLIALVILFVMDIKHLLIVQGLLIINVLFYYMLDGCPLTTIERYYMNKIDDTYIEKQLKIGKVKHKRVLLEKKSGMKRLIFSYTLIAIKIMFLALFRF
jgi:hypothetical protein